jgi:hypothetical protein
MWTQLVAPKHGNGFPIRDGGDQQSSAHCHYRVASALTALSGTAQVI